MEKHVLIAASHYKQQYFFNNEEFSGLPEKIKTELRHVISGASIATGGIVILGFYNDGEVYLEGQREDEDFEYDEIAAKEYLNFLFKGMEEEGLLQSLGIWFAYERTKDVNL